ncbi:hypothetical protein FisN_5Lh473 [Fistulifera solaris]|uniref:Phytanoyl-CoA dioxygenase n=1 Tax=Fistulifera solaris TaxID=1519565 RepID=A0A1Z5KGP6_FISSO|nr:hypothetical protein FisN_5Lh473 [Fistulifera solaris]|eukprot:GAX25376.1 hypothetical protein FisN_5Lh473 [Fistulifera solaris]
MVSLRQRPQKSPTPARSSKRLQTKKPEPKVSVKPKTKQPKKPERKLLYRKTEPLYLECPKTGEKVWITAANIQDIRQAEKKAKSPFNAARKYLLKVNAPNAREEAYDRAAKALERWEEQLLPTYGGRPWKVQVRVQDPLPTETKAAQKYPYFRFYKGVLELAAWPHIIEKIPDPPRFPGFSSPSSSSRKATSKEEAGDESCSEEESLSGEDKIIQMLQEREPSVISELALQERWRVPLPRISTKWISPLRETFASRKAAWDRAVELCKQEITIDKALLGVGGNGKPLKVNSLSRKIVMDAGRLRFERDGLWVVGQEENWQRNRSFQDANESAPLPSSNNRGVTGLTYFLQCKRKEHREGRLNELKKAKVSGATGDIVDVQVGVYHPNVLSQSSRSCDGTMSKEDPSDDGKNVDTFDSILSPDCKRPSDVIIAGDEAVTAHTTSTIAEDRSATYDRSSGVNKVINVSDSEDNGTAVTGSVTVVKPPEPKFKRSNDLSRAKISFTLRDAENELRTIWKKLPEEERKEWDTQAKEFSGVLINGHDGAATLVNAQPHMSSLSRPFERLDDSDSNIAEDSVKRIVTPLCLHKSSRDSPCTSREERKELLCDGHSKKFCLNDDQIKLCHDACVNHYEQIMRTVRVRDLARELQGGFDLFRERGRGRFDMELPQFDNPEFGFLTDLKKAPWMPVVKEILGKEVCLIHKGIFLAMPGAEKQNYHQDGVHLTSQYQKPCHAINVFVPLVDLTNQGTEFCLGSHILGNEDLDNEFLFTPSVTAGTPIVFDYRLGHRGLANTSSSIRPVVYCTYAVAADGKEFRDLVNFSRKRYKPIGDLVDVAPSREERAKKRGKADNVADLSESSTLGQ